MILLTLLKITEFYTKNIMFAIPTILITIFNSKIARYAALAGVLALAGWYVYDTIYDRGYEAGETKTEAIWQGKVKDAVDDIKKDNSKQKIREVEARIVIESEKEKLELENKKSKNDLKEEMKKNKELFLKLDKICVVPKSTLDILNR